MEIYRTYHGITQEDIDESKDDIIIEKKFLIYKIIQPSATRFETKIERGDGTITTLDNYMWEESLKEMVETGEIYHSWTKVNTSPSCGCNNACFHSCMNIG